MCTFHANRVPKTLIRRRHSGAHALIPTLLFVAVQAIALDHQGIAMPVGRSALSGARLARGLAVSVAPPSAPAAAPAPAEKLPGEVAVNSCLRIPAGKRVVRLNLKPDAGVMDLVEWISSITCAQFVVAVPVAGKKVTIISPELITPEEAYRLFFSALDSLALTVEKNGRFLRIIESAKARFAPLPIVGLDGKMPRDRRYVTQLIRMHDLDAADFTNKVLNRVKGHAGDIIAYHGYVIITDLSDNVERMARIIREFDSPSNPRDKIWVVRIKHMSVFDIASRLAEIAPVGYLGNGQRVAGGRRPPTPKPVVQGPPGDLMTELTITKLIPDERSNSLIVVANQHAYDWLLTLIHRLDVPGDASSPDELIHVYYCANADCNELAATLSAITGAQIVGSLANPQKGKGGRRPAPPAKGAKTHGLIDFEGTVRVTYDAPTNSLVILSTYRDYDSIREVIETLDSPRKQVFIEATIMEVLLDKTRQLGVSYHGGAGKNIAGQPSLFMGGFNANQTMNPTALVNNLGGLSAALFGPTTGDLGNSTLFKGLPINIPSFGVFLQLLQTNNDVNILSRPDLLIMNNQEGEISVGEVLPFPSTTSMALSGTTGAMPFTSVQRQPVELKLKLSPSVNESDIVRLDVDQTISDVTSQNYNGMGPATSKRSIKTTVVVGDQQTVVIGGLMADRIGETVTKIPILGDIPVLGFFFRNTTKTIKKSNILIALTPYVISDLSDLRRVAEHKLRDRREFIQRYSALDDTSTLDKIEIDYHRKRGMLEEINRAAREMEKDEAALHKIREREMEDDSQPIEPPQPAASDVHVKDDRGPAEPDKPRRVPSAVN
jgi:general secretion pathway protein D